MTVFRNFNINSGSTWAPDTFVCLQRLIDLAATTGRSPMLIYGGPEACTGMGFGPSKVYGLTEEKMFLENLFLYTTDGDFSDPSIAGQLIYDLELSRVFS